MKKLTFFCVLSFFIATTDGQNKEDANGNLIGLLNKSDFLQGNHNRWFMTHYNEYEPEKKIINKIKKHPIIYNRDSILTIHQLLFFTKMV